MGTSLPLGSNISLLSLLDKGYTFLDTKKVPANVLCLMGNTGTGKTTLAHTIAGDLTKLHVIRTGASGKCHVEDENGKISRPSLLSTTFLPEQWNTEENVYFYDCPGFNDTRGAEEDIAANYFLNQIVSHAKAVKLVFVTSYTSLQDRIEFELLTTHVAQFIADIPKHAHSIGIVFTKVPNYDSGTAKSLEDKEVMEELVTFLELCRQDLQESLRTCNEDEKTLTQQKVQFLEALLTEGPAGGSPTKIWFSRVPQPNKQLLSECSNAQFIRENAGAFFNHLRYSPVSPDDFRYTVKAEAQPHLQKATDEINKEITTQLDTALQGFFKWFRNSKMASVPGTVTYLADCTYSTWVEMEACVNQVDSENGQRVLLLFITFKTITDFWKKVGYMSPDTLTTFVRRAEQILSFLDKISGKQVTRNKDMWVRPLRECLEKVDVVMNWYDFCTKLERRLRSYDFQKSKCQQPLPPAGVQMLEYVHAHVMPVEAHILQKTEVLTERDWGEFVNIVTFAMRQTQVTNAGGVVTVEGNFVRFGEFVQGAGNVDGWKVQVFCVDTVYVDVDLRHAGLQVILVSPKVEVIGQRTVDVSGNHGAEIVPPTATAGNYPGGHGINGVPGNPGSPGGSVYVLLNQLTDGPCLSLISNGGSGSRGQHGGPGANGHEGRNATMGDASSTTYDDVGVFHRERWRHPGFPGGNGGNGGSGGFGGIGAPPGVITVNSLGDPAAASHVHIVAIHGSNGEGGLGSPGGAGGRNGYGFHRHIKKSLFGRKSNDVSCPPATPTAPNGSHGQNNAVGDGHRYPDPVVDVNVNDLKDQCQQTLNKQTDLSDVIQLIEAMLSQI